MNSLVNKKKLVAYLIAPVKMHTTILFSSDLLQIQQASLTLFLNSHPEYDLINTFFELAETKRQQLKWPELKKATECCINDQADLVIPEIKNLISNKYFSDLLLNCINQNRLLFCCDQPFIHAGTLSAVVEHNKQQRSQHGDLIKAGLKRSHAKSGNPHAIDELNRVNKSKISHAIIYSLLLHPIIEDYAQNGYSQRKMVDMLNLEGYSAPEGGTWVLSQLQKMLERMKVNQTALLLESRLSQEFASGLNSEQIAQKLNQEKKVIPPRSQDSWTEDLVNSVYKRSVQIRDILKFNDLMIALTPILNEYRVDEIDDNITDTIFAKAVCEQMAYLKT